jgi:hypothetical protein
LENVRGVTGREPGRVISNGKTQARGGARVERGKDSGASGVGRSTNEGARSVTRSRTVRATPRISPGENTALVQIQQPAARRVEDSQSDPGGAEDTWLVHREWSES